jgi:hypothetical protein
MGRVAERAWIAPNLDRPKVPSSTGHFRPITSADPQKLCTPSPPSCFASSQASAQHLDLSVIEPATDGCLGSGNGWLSGFHNDSDDALWQELKQERFTTPLLRGWLPHARKELEFKSLLTRCHTLECTCCILTATSADLDSIVEFGLKNGVIAIQEEAG